ncbi:MAG: TolC family protein [Crocinitomicaceae bacterium]|jgi:outer membrane protein TolC|nr:TolC family protein [Crocinitomicaceae bacterium]
MKNIKIALGCVILIGTQSFAQEGGLSAQQAVFNALKNNYDIQVATQQEAIAEKNNSWSEAGLFPTVTLQVGQNNLIQDNTNNPFTFTPGVILNQGFSPSLVANVNIFSGFQVKMSKQRLEQLQEQTKGNSAVVIENLIRDVLKTYYTAVLQKERAEFQRSVLEYSRRRLRYNEIKNSYSSTNSLELLQLKNQYLTDSTNLLLQELSYKNSLRNLALLMNNEKETNVEEMVLSDDLQVLLSEINLEDARRNMMTDNQNLKNQFLNYELQQTAIEFQRSFLYPTLALQLNASPSFGRFEQLSGGNPNGPSSISTQNLAYSGNFTLRYNVYNNWKSKRAVEVAKIQADIQSLNIEKLKETLETNLVNMYDLFQVRNNLLRVSEENLQYAQKAYELAQKRYELGSINSVELQVIQNNYQNTQVQHFENLYNRLDVYIDLYQLTGKLQLEYKQ